MASEKQLDQALHAELEASDDFRRWFAGRLAAGPGFTKLILCRSNHPWGKVRLIVPDPHSGALVPIEREGETDVLLVLEDAEGRRLGVHIENKQTTSKFTKLQPELYAARAEAWIGSDTHGSYTQWETVLIAPAAFISRNREEVRKFITSITYEEMAERVQLFGT